MSTTDLFLVVVVLAALVLALAFSHKTSHDLAVQVGASVPAFIYQGGKATIATGLDQLDVEAKSTPEPFDDEAVDRIRAIVSDYLSEVDAARSTPAAPPAANG